VYEKGIEVDKATIDLNSDLPIPTLLSRSYHSLAMPDFIGDLLRTSAKWLAHLLIFYLKIILLSLMSLV